MRIVYTGTFDCPICGKQEVDLYGTETPKIDDDFEREIVEEFRWRHWCKRHHNCAVCGEFVSPDDLEVAINDGSIKIHSAYTDYYRKIRLGDIHGPLLNVHRQCISGK